MLPSVSDGRCTLLTIRPRASSSAVANVADLVEVNSDDAYLTDDDETKQSSATILDPVGSRERKPIVHGQAEPGDDGEDSGLEEVEAQTAWTIAQLSARPQADESACSVRVPDLIYPKSAYEGWEPPLPPSSEAEVLAEFRVSGGKLPSIDVIDVRRRRRTSSSSSSANPKP